MKTYQLVTGAAGLIGFDLAKQLLEEKKLVIAVDNYLKNGQDDLLQLKKKYPRQLVIIEGNLTEAGLLDNLDYAIDTIFHMAAIVGVRYVTENPYKTIRDNCLSVLNVTDFAIRKKPRTFVFASSSENYASGVDNGMVPIPTPEDVPLIISDVFLPRWSYATSKIAGESAVWNAARISSFKPVIIRFHNVYGPRMKPTHVIPELIERAKKRINPFPVYGYDQTRSFIFIEDAVRAVLMAAEAKEGLYNVGSSKEVAISDLAELIFNLTNFHPQIEKHPAPPGSVHRRLPNITKIMNLGFVEKVSLEQGIQACQNQGQT